MCYFALVLGGDDAPAYAGSGPRSVWRTLTEPSAQVTNRDDRHRARFLSSLLVAGIPVGLVTLLDANQFDTGGRELAIGAVAAMVVAYGISRTRFYLVAAWMAIIAVVGPPFGVILEGGSAVNVGFMGLGVVFAGILLGARASLVVAGVAAALLAGWAYATGGPAMNVDARLGLAFLVPLSLLVVLGVHHRRAVEADRLHLLEASEQRYRGLFDTTFAGFALIRDGKIVEANAGFAEIFGYRLVDLQGKALEELIAEGSRRAVQTGLDGSFSSPREIRGRRKDGRNCYLEFVSRSQPGNGKEVQFFAVRDLTRRKQIEARLSIVDRAASIGTLAAGVAHQINNPLQYVVTNLGYLQETVASDPKATEAVEGALEGASRVKKIVRDLRELSQPSDDKPGPTDVNDAIELACRMVDNEVRARANLVKEFGDVPLTHGSRARLGQVFLNILTNAFQALPEGEPADNEVKISTGVADDGCVVIRISDTGAGMSRAALRRAFEPFYTTKGMRKGTGLGLAIARGIVTGLGGSVRLDSALGQGTTVTVMLQPAEAEISTEMEPINGQDSDSQNGEAARILVIDDEVDVGQSIERALARHDVTTLTSAKKALALFDEEHAEFDVIFCDLMMPEMSGMDFFARLRSTHADQAKRVVFISGGTFTPRAMEFIDEVDNPLLEKPFSVTELREAVARTVKGRKKRSPSVA